jgi:hypothetical protein
MTSIQYVKYDSMAWSYLPIPENGVKYVFSHIDNVLISLSLINDELIAEVIIAFTDNVDLIGKKWSLGAYEFMPGVVDGPDGLIITEGGGCVVETYRDVPKQFNIYVSGSESNFVIGAVVTVLDTYQLEVNLGDECYIINLDFNINSVTANGQYLYVNCDCKANDFDNEAFAFMAIIEWATGATEYINVAAEFIMNVGRYLLISPGNNQEIEGYKKIINVPDYFIIYEKKLVVDDELTLAKLTL